MAQVGVNKDGTEVIGKYLSRGNEDFGSVYETNKIEGKIWFSIYNDPDWGMQNIAIPLPKGTIKKLIGRELTWEDEAVTLEE